MTFSEFAQRLWPIIGAGENQGEFVKTILETMVDDEYMGIAGGKKLGTYKSYYQGNTQITMIARTIAARINPEQFVDYINSFDDAAVDRIYIGFKSDLPDDTTAYNIGEKLAYLFEQILIEAAATKRRSPKKATQNNKCESAHDEKMVAGLLSSSDKELLRAFRKDSKNTLSYIIRNDPMAGPTKVDLCDEIEILIGKWELESFEIRDQVFKNLVIKIIEVLSEYKVYLVNEFLRTFPENDMVWIRNESWEEGERLRDVLQPKMEELRQQAGDLYREIYSIPDDV